MTLRLIGAGWARTGTTSIQRALKILGLPCYHMRTVFSNLADTVLATGARHNDEVIETIPPERLLRYDVAEGWVPLCELLGVDVPDVAFPHLNRRDEWHR